MLSARYTIIALLSPLCLVKTSDAFACEPNRQDKKAKSCWIDQPDLLYSWLLDIPLREPEFTHQQSRYVPKAPLPKGPVSIPLPEAPAVDHKPAMDHKPTKAPQPDELVKPEEEALPKLWLQIDTTVTDVYETDLIIRQVTQLNNPLSEEGGAGWQMLQDVSAGWTVHHRAIWEMPLTTTEISSAFESQINIEMQGLFTPQSAPQMFSGAGTMWFSPAFQEGGISNIELYSDNDVQIIGDMAFLTDEALSGVFLDRMASLSLSRGDEQEIWHASIAFTFQNDDEITTVRGALAGISEDEPAALIGYFSSEPE